MKTIKPLPETLPEAYQNWLKNPQTTPPVDMEPEGLHAALKYLRLVYGRNLQKLGRSTTQEQLQQAAKRAYSAQQGWFLLVAWAEYVLSRQPSQVAEALRKELAQDGDAILRWDQRNTKKVLPALNKLAKKQRGSWRKTLLDWRAEIKDSTQFTDSSAGRSDRQFAAKERNFTATHPGFLLRSARDLDGLKPVDRRAILKHASRTRNGGFRLPYNTDVLQGLVAWANRPTVRNTARQAVRELVSYNAKSVDRWRSGRQQEAESQGADNYASYCLSSDRVCQDIHDIRHFLKQEMTQSSAMRRRIEEVLLETGRQWIKNPKTADLEWIRYKINKEAGCWPTEAFPIESTVPKIVAEIFHWAKWRVRQASSPAAGIMHFFLTRGNQSKQLWIRTTDPAEDVDAVDGGYALTRNFQGQDHILVNIVLQDSYATCLGTEDLVTLCHELGHAVHYAANRNGGSTPRDMIEVPSLLMEMYPFDPDVLTRWSAEPKSRAYWQKLVNIHAAMHLWADLDDEVASVLDMESNYRKNDGIQDIAREVMSMDKVPDNEIQIRLPEYINESVFLDLDLVYFYTMDRRIARALLAQTCKRKGFRLGSAEAVGRTLQALEAKVLRSNATGRSARKVWHDFTGYGTIECAKHGGRQIRRQQRIALRHFEKFAAKISQS